jgi:hypothetical protein
MVMEDFEAVNGIKPWAFIVLGYLISI